MQELTVPTSRFLARVRCFRESRPRFRHSENANGPGNPEAVARTDKSVPRQGHLYIQTTPPDIKYFKESRTPSSDPPLVPRDNPPKKEWTWRTRPSPRTLTGPVLPLHTAPRAKAYFSCAKLQALSWYYSSEVSFWNAAEKVCTRCWSPFPEILHPR